MGKKGDFHHVRKAEVKALMNAKLFSNHEISRRLKVSEASVRRIKKKIESGEELSPKRKKKCGRKPIFTSRSEKSLKKTCLENRFATTKMIKLQLQDINVNASRRTVRRKLKDFNFKTCRSARNPMLTLAMKANSLNWAKRWRDKDVDFWRSGEQLNPVGAVDQSGIGFELLLRKPCGGNTGGHQFHVKLAQIRKYGGPPKIHPKLNSLGSRDVFQSP
ncbi:hypothetical protein TNCV_2992381 [Trichonephila clavipes]|nr:hypothetical protein TNCV_2992381 [Trichonephila clavipes]